MNNIQKEYKNKSWKKIKDILVCTCNGGFNRSVGSRISYGSSEMLYQRSKQQSVVCVHCTDELKNVECSDVVEIDCKKKNTIVLNEVVGCSVYGLSYCP